MNFYAEQNQSQQIHQILKKYWGYDGFRPLQEDIILSVLNNQDTLALLPTGGGKSICFQVPALAKDGLCLVISPLIALMKDQVENLKKRGIKAGAVYSGVSAREMDILFNNATFDKDFKFLYLSPERLKTDTFRLVLEKMNVSMIAVDEAHCISQWGYDFRPPYLEIAEIRSFFPSVPILALTATATPEVVDDIQEKLKFHKKNVFQKSFKRDNLTYYVVKEEDKNGRLLRIAQRYKGTGIIYVRNRRKTKEVALFLKQHNIPADFYHAGLDAATRDKKQNDWMVNKTRIIVSTNAFGMGIDKPDVRFVVHIDIPDTLEAYFQEAGRGGRDEKDSIAVMLYDNNDIRELKRNFTLSYPTIETIHKIYDSLANYFHIAVRSGKNATFPFDILQFSQKFKLNLTTVYNSIKLLEKAGVLFYIEDENRQSVMHIPVGKNELLNFEKNNPNEALFLKTILRSYGGLFSDFIRINELELASRLEITEEEVIRLLKKLVDKKIIHYREKSLKPTLVFAENRSEKEDILLDKKEYYQRKEVAQKRLDAVLTFVKEENLCRSRVLLRYFGELKSTPCGSCDICLKNKKNQLTDLELKKYKKVILESLQGKRLSIRQLTSSLSVDYDEDKVIKTIRLLIDIGEIKIEVGELFLP